MRWLLFWSCLGLIASTPLRGQGAAYGVCTATFCGSLSSPSSIIVYGDDDIGRAMVICEKHRAYSVVATSPETVRYRDGWDACWKVREKWDKSEAARHYREQQEQEARDLDLVERVAR